MNDVLLLADQLRRPVPGGIGTYVRGLLHGLDEMLRAGEAVPPVELYAGKAAEDDELSSSHRPVLESRLPTRLLTKAWDLGVVDVPRRFAVVHATSPATPPARHAALAAMVHDTAWRAVPDTFPRRGRRWHEAALQRVVGRADLVVVPTHSLREELERGSSPPRRVAVVPLGCDHLPPPDDRGAERVLARHGVVGPFILSVGTLEPRKNLPRLAAAFRQAGAELGSDLSLVVAGPSGWGHIAVGGDPRLVVVGAVGPAVLAALYHRARLVAYIPVVEGYGLPPLEAMRAGTPVVTSPVPSVQEGGRPDAAFVVDPHDVDAIAEALVRVADDGPLRAGLVAAGREVAASRSWAAAARSHVELWRSLA